MTTCVLVVDDESVSRRVVSHTLKTLAIEVIGAENGVQAIELAREGLFQLAIVDINLPDINGFDVIRQIKQLPHFANVPVIMFTARNHAGDRAMADEVGAVDFLYKPFSTQELRELVLKHLR